MARQLEIYAFSWHPQIKVRSGKLLSVHHATRDAVKALAKGLRARAEGDARGAQGWRGIRLVPDDGVDKKRGSSRDGPLPLHALSEALAIPEKV